MREPAHQLLQYGKWSDKIYIGTQRIESLCLKTTPYYNWLDFLVTNFKQK